MIYADVPGGKELLAWFGKVPTFHDAEIISLSLCPTGVSELKIHGWITTGRIDPNGYFVLEQHAVVTFSLEDILDLQLDGFSRQNVISDLILQRPKDRGRSSYHATPGHASDIELELLPCYGLDGFIRAKKVAISFVPGPPPKA